MTEQKQEAGPSADQPAPRPDKVRWWHGFLLANEFRPLANCGTRQGKDLVRRFFEALAQRDLDALEEMMVPEFVNHTKLPDREDYLGREGYKRRVADEQTAFSDFRFIIEDQAAEGDKVITRSTVSATHDRGKVLGFAPTGREIETSYITIHRIVEGKIAEEWTEGGGLQELTEQRLEQERIERERVEQELRVARRIQQASLPKGVPELKGWEISRHYRPAREVGGDFYGFHVLSDDRVGLVIGDATGKGVPAALVMSTTCGMLRVAAQEASDSPSSPPGRYSNGSTRLCLPTSRPARSSPASTPSSSFTVAASGTLTLGITSHASDTRA